MKEKIKHYQKKLLSYLEHLYDVRVIGMLLFLVVVLLISWSGVKVIDTNYRLQRDISKLQQQNDVQKLSNENLRFEKDYLNTTQYLDITARKNFGLAAPGETVLLVPKEAALAHTVDLPDLEKIEVAKTTAKQPAYQRNFQAWISFFLHRQDAGI
jgi:cell division protein FtsL